MDTPPKIKIGVIVASVKDSRISNSITAWILRVIPKSENVEYILIDLKTWNNNYNNNSNHSWSHEISEKSGFIWILPEYHYGFPVSIQNSLDSLNNKEWNCKPAVLISYGFGGSDKAATHLKPILVDTLSMKIIDTQPQLIINSDLLDKNTGQFYDINSSFKEYVSSVNKAINELHQFLNNNNSNS